jgi:hypothetical protein
MSIEYFHLPEVTQESANFWLRKAKTEELTAIEAACLVYNKEPPTTPIPTYRLPAWIQEFAEKLEDEYPPSPYIEKRMKDWRNMLEAGFFCLPPDNTFSIETIIKAIKDMELGFKPKFICKELNCLSIKPTKLNIQQKREAALLVWLEDQKRLCSSFDASELSRERIWEKLRSIDPALFGPQNFNSERFPETVKKFFEKQKHIKIKQGRK